MDTATEAQSAAAEVSKLLAVLDRLVYRVAEREQFGAENLGEDCPELYEAYRIARAELRSHGYDR